MRHPMRNSRFESLKPIEKPPREPKEKLLNNNQLNISLNN